MLTINKFMFKADGVTLEVNLSNNGTSEEIYKIEIWNYDNSDYKREIPLENTVPYVYGGVTYNITGSVAKEVILSTLGLKNTMIRGVIYTIDTHDDTMKQYGIACSNLRDIYLAIVSDLTKLNASFMFSNSIPAETERNIDLIENIMAAHKDSIMYGFHDDAAYFYAQLLDLCLNRR